MWEHVRVLRHAAATDVVCSLARAPSLCSLVGPNPVASQRTRPSRSEQGNSAGADNASSQRNICLARSPYLFLVDHCSGIRLLRASIHTRRIIRLAHTRVFCPNPGFGALQACITRSANRACPGCSGHRSTAHRGRRASHCPPPPTPRSASRASSRAGCAPRSRSAP
ncbi:hypothetical protein FA95DRAFT_961616 [Auriscalpium vulgare]|uniref:Uncharacterized protein n=1 Tax=Auriscalpium vulgare TaxID=40419 RepID=A0ACB8RYE3_9AGAM|nr:hypothetical protein FA95DRAFT_961616 [Auriscalpium vulgare]